MATFFAVCNVNGPISREINAESLDAALVEFAGLNHSELIDDASTDAEDCLEFCGDGMSEDEFSAAMSEHGYEPVQDLSAVVNGHSGVSRHEVGGWMLYGATK